MNSQPTEDQRKAAALFGLAKMYRESLDSDMVKVWIDLLSGYTASQVENGVRHCLLNKQKREMPSPAELIGFICKASGLPSHVDEAKSLKAQAEAEWEQVNDHVRRVGSYGNPRFHPTTERVIRSMGGWGAVCAWETASKEWKHRDFVRLWQDFHEVGDAMDLGAFGVQQALSERMSQRPAELPHGWLKRIQ
jgi:hypothetical protein